MTYSAHMAGPHRLVWSLRKLTRKAQDSTLFLYFEGSSRLAKYAHGQREKMKMKSITRTGKEPFVSPQESNCASSCHICVQQSPFCGGERSRYRDSKKVMETKKKVREASLWFMQYLVIMIHASFSFHRTLGNFHNHNAALVLATAVYMALEPFQPASHVPVRRVLEILAQ